MLTLKSSKHRCQCYTMSGSLLYGLRRDAPSTERVLLERLVNILSRAAATKNKNPQRLWAESERPEWWTEVTDLPWKNPREHPKDNKDTLKKKMDILEKQLKQRNLMTKELEEELAIHRNSKKIDLELKSDFEAIISKASGLHFLLDKVSAKMRQTPLISEKMATYINETKSCVDKIHKRISAMEEEVKAREERRSDLWVTMGVSKGERSMIPEDMVIEPFNMDPDLGFMDAFNYLTGDSSNRLYPDSTMSPSPTSPSSTTEAVSPQPPELTGSAFLSSPVVSPGSFLVSWSNSEPSTEPVRMVKFERSVSATVQKASSQSSGSMTAIKSARSVDLIDPQTAFASVSSVPKRTWEQSEVKKTTQLEQTRVKSPRVHEFVTTDPQEVIVIDDDDKESGRSSEIVSSSGKSASVSNKHEPLRNRILSKHFKHLHPQTKKASSTSEYMPPGEKAFEPPSSMTSLKYATTPSTSLQHSEKKKASTMSKTTRLIRSEPHSSSDDKGLPVDVVEDADLEMVDEILEDSPTPTITMYAPDISGMDQLAEMTSALSCEELRPSFTERFMTGELPRPSTATTSTAQPPGYSLSQPLWTQTSKGTAFSTVSLLKPGIKDVMLGQGSQTPDTSGQTSGPVYTYIPPIYGGSVTVPRAGTRVEGIPGGSQFQSLQTGPTLVAGDRVKEEASRPTTDSHSLSRAIGDFFKL